MARWAPALRMARRDLLRHRWRSALTFVLVALPVTAGVAAAEISHNTRYDGERQAHEIMGTADAVAEVTPYAGVRVTFTEDGLDGTVARPASFTQVDGRRTAVRRPRSEVDLTRLLPAGSRVLALRDSRAEPLAGGGVANVSFLDLDDPLTVGLGALADGSAPEGANEVAVPRSVADELGMLDADGRLRSGALLRLLEGPPLRVVGLTDPRADEVGVTVVAAPGSRLAPRRTPTRYLVDLPASSGPAPHASVVSLARDGVALTPRDLAFHPRAWGVKPATSPVDATSLTVGALAVGLGLGEVVLIVGSAFAIGARRQVRDLGLLAASGGAPSDVRRVLLAQGLVLGAGASVLGAAAGFGVFLLGLPVFERVARTTVWTRDVDWAAILTVTALGSVTGVVAALVPAWSIGRLSPVASLSGRFPVRAGEARAHRPAVVLAGLGLLMLGTGGVWTAHEYAPPPRTMPETEMFAHQPSPVPVLLAALGLLLLVAAVVWSAPSVVRRMAGLGRVLTLSGRFAFRDAARHRFRTAAAAIAVMTTAAAAVLAGFVVQAVEAKARTADGLPPHSLLLYNLADGGPDSPQQAMRALETTRRIVGPVTAHTSSRITSTRGLQSELGIPSPGGGSSPVAAVDEDTLRFLVGDHDRAVALRTYRAGGLVTTSGRGRAGTVSLRLEPEQESGPNRFRLPAVRVTNGPALTSSVLSAAWVSPATARRLGLVTTPSTMLVTARRPVTGDDVTRLSVHGLDVFSSEAELAPLLWVRTAALAAAGLLTLLVVGIAVALSAAEGGADLATMTAVGAGPWRRRSLGAMHGLFLGLVGALLGIVVGVPAGAALTQVDGLSGVQVPWVTLLGVLVVVPLLAWSAGGVATSSRVSPTRRAA